MPDHEDHHDTLLSGPRDDVDYGDHAEIISFPPHVPPGLAGVAELASRLRVQPFEKSLDGARVLVLGRDGQSYDLAQLIGAFLDRVDRVEKLIEAAGVPEWAVVRRADGVLTIGAEGSHGDEVVDHILAEDHTTATLRLADRLEAGVYEDTQPPDTAPSTVLPRPTDIGGIFGGGPNGSLG